VRSIKVEQKDKKEKKERRRKSHEDPSLLVEKKQEPLKESASDTKIQEPEKPQASSDPVQETHSPTVPETTEIENKTPTETPPSSDDATVEQSSTVVTEPETSPQTEVQPEVKKKSFKQAVKSKLEFEMEPKVELDVKALISSLLEPIAGVSFFTVGLLLAFIMGYFGFQLLWVLILIYVFHKMDSKLQERIRRREFRKLLRERELEERAVSIRSGFVYSICTASHRSNERNSSMDEHDGR
jgi:Ca2+-dependent lipid-binding protein